MARARPPRDVPPVKVYF